MSMTFYLIVTIFIRQYKDVFFSKNPNFKWYKLPAPPLRTLSTRPTNDRSMVASPTPNLVNDEIAESTIKDRAARNVKLSHQNSSGIGQFKFASIDQMGGLTSLMAMGTGMAVKVNGTIYVEKGNEKSEVFVDESTAKKRKNDDHLELFDEQDVVIAGKSHRACKGKRYEQFMTPSKKATKPKSTNPVTSTSVQFPHNGYCKPQETLSLKHDDSSDELSNIAVASPESDETEQRNADAADFKLNEKIMTLPSLDLDDYLNRKKAMKKKKKFTRKFKEKMTKF
jgi:HMG box transcription factor BBX